MTLVRSVAALSCIAFAAPGCHKDEPAAPGSGGEQAPAQSALPTPAATAPSRPGAAAASAAPAPGDLGPQTPRLVGRVDRSDRAGPRLGWPATAIVTSFAGTGLTAHLRDSGTSFFSVSVDGAPPTTLSTHAGTEEYPVAKGLPPAKHTVVLTKRTEASYGVVQLLSMVPVGAGLLAPPPAPTRQIEFIGDSIACGMGELGAGPACESTAANEDASMAYPALTATALRAEASVVAYSGIGVYRSRGAPAGVAMPSFYSRTLPDDASSAWSFAAPLPDAVVVDLGTNDFAHGDPGEGYEKAYVAFLEQVRSRVPQAQIVCALSAMLSDEGTPTGRRSKARQRIQSVVKARVAAGDARTAFLEFDEQRGADGFGCDAHPSYVTHQRMAAKLAAALRPWLGW